MVPRSLIASLGAALALGLPVAAAAAPLPYRLAVAAPASGIQGTAVDVALTLTLDATAAADAAGFALLYDPTLMQLLGATAGSLNPAPGFFTDIFEATPGRIDVSTLDLALLGWTGPLSGSLAEFSFELLAPGVAALDLADVIVAQAGNALADVAVSGARIDVQPAGRVPAPATAWLVGAALAALACSRRRATAR